MAAGNCKLKGAGLTPYSRNGDGRAVLRSSIREYLCSEAMHGLGIPTTRALSIVGSADEVYREQVETAAVVMRMAPSFVRFGSFEVFFSRGQPEAIRILADYVIARHFPELVDTPDKSPAFPACRGTGYRTPDGTMAGSRFCPRRDEHR